MKFQRARKAYDEYTKGSEKYAHLGSSDMEKVHILNFVAFILYAETRSMILRQDIFYNC